MGMVNETGQDNSQAERDAEDRALVERIRAHDGRAFESLMTRYSSQVQGVCYGILRDYEEAKDASQEIFLRVHTRLDSYDVERSFRPWLMRIARNHCIDLQRRRPAQPNIDLEVIEFLQASKEAGPEQAALDREGFERQLARIKKLPDKYQVVVGLFLQGLSYVEIAQRTNQTINAIKTQLHRARRKLEGNDPEEGGT